MATREGARKGETDLSGTMVRQPCFEISMRFGAKSASCFIQSIKHHKFHVECVVEICSSINMVLVLHILVSL